MIESGVFLFADRLRGMSMFVSWSNVGNVSFKTIANTIGLMKTQTRRLCVTERCRYRL